MGFVQKCLVKREPVKLQQLCVNAVSDACRILLRAAKPLVGFRNLMSKVFAWPSFTRPAFRASFIVLIIHSPHDKRRLEVRGRIVPPQPEAVAHSLITEA